MNRGVIELLWQGLCERPPQSGEAALAATCEAIAGLEPEDVGLPELMAKLDRRYGWTAHDLAVTGDLHLSLFLVPEGRLIPLHDHPGMTVVLRAMWGRLELQSLDWDRDRPFSGWAWDRGAAVLDGASAPAVVGPERGNIHSIRALEDCAFLDLFAPGYDPEAGRECSYFEVCERGGAAWRLVKRGAG